MGKTKLALIIIFIRSLSLLLCHFNTKHISSYLLQPNDLQQTNIKDVSNHHVYKISTDKKITWSKNQFLKNIQEISMFLIQILIEKKILRKETTKEVLNSNLTKSLKNIYMQQFRIIYLVIVLICVLFKFIFDNNKSDQLLGQTDFNLDLTHKRNNQIRLIINMVGYIHTSN